MKHAKLSASGSARWLNCTGSVKAEAPFKNTTNSAAQEGTCAHELADIVLSKGVNSQDYLNKTLDDEPTVVVNQEMIDYIDGYVEYVKDLGGEQFYEVKLDFSHLVPEGFGTSDCIVFSDNTLHCVDLKYGYIYVDAKDNTQAMLYALGAIEEYDYIFDIDKIVLHIYQPRIGNFSTWEVSLAELEKFGQYAKAQATEALGNNAPRTASDKACQWCRAKSTCQALQSHTVEVLGGDFDDLDEIQTVDTLTDEQLVHALNNKKLIESWLKAVEQHITEKITDGEKVHGFKLVTGKSPRKWANIADAERQLRGLLNDDAFEQKLLSPSKAEKALGAKRVIAIEHLIVKTKGGPTLVPENDKRPALENNIDDFKIIT